MTSDGDELVVARRFQGPPDCANGGYVCGLLAARMAPGPLRVTLRRPVPLERALGFEAVDGGGLALVVARSVTEQPSGLRSRSVAAMGGEPAHRGGKSSGSASVAEPDGGEPLAVAVGCDLPDIGEIPQVGLEEARVLPLDERLVSEHPFPDCFGCGPNRDRSDAVAISPRRLASGVYAAAWTPGPGLPHRPNGELAPECVWAALDCPSSFPAVPPGPPPHVLGRLEGDVRAPILVGEEVVCVSWSLGGNGRKRYGASALLGPGGDVRAVARATWIALE